MGIRELLRDVDRLLRGGFTRPDDLKAGRIPLPVQRLVAAGVLLGVVYGLFMGLYAALRSTNPSVLQLFATAFKVPLLFLLTLVVTYPSLYVFSALANSRLESGSTLRLLLVAIAVNLALLASFGPVTGFFTLSTESYPFMVVLNVAAFAVSGLAGLVFLRRALDVVFESGDDPPGRDPGRGIFKVWILIYGVVGAQMGWILRPFVGSPDLPFTLFRARDSNFFEAVFGAVRLLLGG